MNDKIEWTSEMEEFLIKCSKEGASSAAIAYRVSQKFKVRASRNSIIGKMHRLQKRGLIPKGKNKPGRRKKARPGRPTPPPIKPRESQGPSLHRPTPPPKVDPLSRETNLPLLDLPHDACRWPMEDGLFCGGKISDEELYKKIGGKAFCPRHLKIATASNPYVKAARSLQEKRS